MKLQHLSETVILKAMECATTLAVSKVEAMKSPNLNHNFYADALEHVLEALDAHSDDGGDK